MKIATVRTADGTRAARVENDEYVLLDARDAGELLDTSDWRTLAQSSTGERVTGASLAPVVPHPRKIVCLGLNYRSHIEEMGRVEVNHPTLFSKFAVSLIGAHDDIVMPPESEKVDWEVELGIVIGARARRVRARAAADVVAGLTVVNDVSMRDWQSRTIQFLQGKTWERSTPVGPWLVTLDEFGGALDVDLELSCSVDDQVMQKHRTSDMKFPPSEIVEYISTIMTLEPGDIIATGTPAGVGLGRTPPVFLRPGQTVRTVIEGIGELVNVTVAERA